MNEIFSTRSLSRRCFFLALGAFLVLFLHAPFSIAQTSGTSTITGTVVDINKAAIPGATVLIRNSDTGIDRTSTTNGDGLFVAPFLQPGHYEVTASGTGFSSVKQENLVLTVGRTVTLDFALHLQTVQQAVTVTGAAPLLDTEKTEVSQTVDSNLISNLPVNGRNWSTFALATPNVVADGTSGLVSYHGISGLYNSNYVDGANNNQALFSEARGRASGAPYVYSLDSIQEFQVDAAVYSAEFGQAAGGQVNAITRSGTNSMHGDLFYFLRYPALNALDSYNKSRGIITQAVRQQQQFGGSAGGPILKDKLFYFFTYDGFRKVAPIAYSSTAKISLTPITTTSTSTISPAQCPATITSTQCTAAIGYLLSLNGSYSRIGKQDIFFPRLDYQINSANHAFADFNWGDYKLPSGYAPNPSYTNSSITTNGNAYYHERFLVGGLTTAISNRSLNEVHLQWGRDLETAGVNAPGPSVTVTNVTTYGEPNALPRTAEPDEHRIQITDIFSTTRGRHTLKIGGDINLVHEVMINLFQGGGIYSYSGTTALANFQSWVQDVFPASSIDPTAGTHYSTFTQVYDPITHVGKDDFWIKEYDGFAEDTWAIRSNLTFNLGARYDLQVTPQPTHPNTSSALATFYTQQLKTVKDRVAPRIGFAYHPYPMTVVRGGYGMFAALTQGSTYYAMRVENGVYQTNYNFNSPSAAGAPIFPNVLFTPPGPALAAPFSGAAVPVVSGTGGSALITSFHGLDPNFVPPLAHEASLAVEQQFPGRLTLSVGYVGTRGLRLPVFIDGNLAPATQTRNYAIYNGSGVQTSSLTEPYYTQRITTANGSINTGFSVLNSWYNSMAVTIKRPFENGLQLLANYTWAKALDEGQVQGTFGTFYGGNYPEDPYNIKGEYGRSDLDQRSRFTGSVVYQPRIFTDNFWAKQLLDNFMFSGTATETTGFPIQAVMSGYPQQIKGTTAVEGGLTGGVMSSSSGAATAGRPAQLQRDYAPGPGLRNIDLRVTRDFPIHEQIHFQIWADAFNVLNHANIFGVNTTSFSYIAPGAKLPSGVACPSVASQNSTFNGCVAPFVSTSAPFGSENSTSGGTLYGERQLQFAAKLVF